ncbi:MAG TPA: response regulator [Candidatus Hydrogenedentes bacterium]|nr:response regulator [Candidatus Hydrogenedentota bacterium]
MYSDPTAVITILVVDDMPENAAILSRFLTPMGYKVEAVNDGETALVFVNKHPPDIILLDLAMPGMDGFEVCQRLKESPETRHIPIIIITGLTDREANIHAIEAGADDFLIKPFDRVLLEARIKNSLKTKILQDQLLEYQHELEERVQLRTQQLERTQQVAVFSLAKLAESRDTETGDHLDRIREYTRELSLEISQGDKYGHMVDNAFILQIYQSSPLHDIGKVGIPDQILLKPGKLTVAEFDLMKTHTLIGGNTLQAADEEAGGNSFLSMGRDIAFYHHEKWDGSGYPYGLLGDAIPLAARIVALADVYDALATKRPYKEPIDHETSKKIIIEGRGKHFDPVVVDAFLAQEERFCEIRGQFQSKGEFSPLHATVDRIAQIQDPPIKNT